jgi:uncharacterized protein (TIGR02588 family)
MKERKQPVREPGQQDRTPPRDAGRARAKQDGAPTRDGGREPGHPRRAAIPAWEWMFACLGLVLVGVTVTTLAYYAITDEGSPPDIRVTSGPAVKGQGGYLVPITAANHGQRTAADVKVQGELRSPSGVVETSESTFTYVPARSRRHGGLLFVNDPSRFTLAVTPKGFEDP